MYYVNYKYFKSVSFSCETFTSLYAKIGLHQLKKDILSQTLYLFM